MQKEGNDNPYVEDIDKMNDVLKILTRGLQGKFDDSLANN
jgi:hypothetical protein